ncbi:MAG TPA: sulfatase-like hydrolase/transferase [Vicinamibacterales bacterium]|nr:sulfatase-like hydrolase/transferase [Vicinamibacterales bacterium]
MRMPFGRTGAALRALGAIALGVMAWGCHGRESSSLTRRSDQNVLLVTIDTLRGDALSVYGGQAHTPNIDAIAARGVRFDFAHAHAVLTRPSHASILTGLYPYEHGVRDHSGYRMKPGTATIATRLKQDGFATGAFVGGVPLAKTFGLDAGFDVYDDRFGRSGSSSDFTLAERPAGDVVAAALAWIGRQPGRWFAWVHFFDPHAPYTPPAPFDAEYAGRPYYGEIAYVDQALGPLFDAVGRSSRPTFLVITSDHGEGLGDHGELTHGLFAYETTLRVPLILAQLGARTTAGTVSRFPARHIDLVPTLLDAVGIARPSGLQGRSLLTGASLPNEGDVASYFEAMSAMLNRGWAPLSGVVAGRQKYIDLPIPELYDLDRDPSEKANLADQRADRRRVLEARLQDFHAAPPGERVAEAPEVAAKLQSLGYTSGRASRRANYTRNDDPKELTQLDRWIQEGIDAWQHGRRDEALRTYERIIEQRPSMAIGYRNLAFLQWQNGQARAAIQTLERAFHADAIEPDMTTQLGSYLAEAGRPADAIALLEPLASQTHADPDALNALGIAYARDGRTDRADAMFHRALDESPANVQALENIGTLEMQRGNLAGAQRALEQALAVDARSARAHNGLGVVAMKAGKRDEAFAHWKRAVELSPSDFDALYNLAVELDAAGRHDEARPYLERFVREAPPAQYAADVARVKRMLGR